MNVLTGVSAPVGTLLGPGRFGRYMVVTAEVEGGVQVDVAGPDAIRAALAREEIHSPAELALKKQRVVTDARQRYQELLRDMATELSRRAPAERAPRRNMVRTGGSLRRRG